ncbi:MAG: hypothetical protein ACOYXN_03905 [Acidobacteriota bacterium]
MKGSRIVAAALAVLFSALGPALGQTTQSQDGPVVLEGDRREARVYEPVGSTLAWAHRDGRLEVYDPQTKKWVPAAGDFPLAAAGSRLLLAYGPDGPGSAVYDLGRHAWVPQFDRYFRGAVSENLAVGYGGPGRPGIYDALSGRWQTPVLEACQVALSGRLAAFFGEHVKTTLYDASRGVWASDASDFTRCALGERLAVFFGPPGTNALLYDSRAGRFVPLREPLQEVKIEGGTALALSRGNRAFAYSGEREAWVEFRGAVQDLSFVNEEALLTDDQGAVWAFRPDRLTFELRRKR